MNNIIHYYQGKYYGLLSGQFIDKPGRIHYHNIWFRINKQSLTPAEQTFR